MKRKAQLSEAPAPDKVGSDKSSLWSTLSLSSQFLVAAGLVLCVAMAVLGTWVNERIKHAVLETSAAQGANFMNGFLEPRVQALASGDVLPSEIHDELDGLFIGTALGNTVVSIKIWRTDGTVLYSTTKDLIGKHFISTDVAKAASGEVIAEYEDLISQESAYEQTLDMALIEVYAPLFKIGTNQVLAVGEIYENANTLASVLQISRATTWAVVCLTTLFMLTVLYAIVRRGASTIAAQRAELSRRVSEAQQLAQQNNELRLIADKARLSASEANEQLLAGIGLDLHDGPIQLLTLSILKLSAPSGSRSDQKTAKSALHPEIAGAIGLTRAALAELRNISSGLSLPEIGEMSLMEALELAIFRHKDTTGTEVKFEHGLLPDQVTEAVKICAYRVIQEVLNNSYKHAKGAEPNVCVSADASNIFITVSDSGPGFVLSEKGLGGIQKLGIAGIRNRVEALKGSVEIVSEPSLGTRVSVKIPLDK